MHTASEIALKAAAEQQVVVNEIQFVPVERDGYTRNGAVAEGLRGAAARRQGAKFAAQAQSLILAATGRRGR